jgi:hypothetical protein
MGITNYPKNNELTFKNKIINGDGLICQRTGPFVSPAIATYTVDRWVYLKSSTATHTISQVTSGLPTVAQAGGKITTGIGIQCTTADTSVGAEEYCSIQQRIEGYNIIDLVGQTFTLSFWAYATKTGIYTISFRNSAQNISYIAEYTVNSSNNWEYKTLTIVGGLPEAGTWGYTTGIGLIIDFNLLCGSTFQTTPNDWKTGNYLGTSNQVNACASTSNNFILTRVQLERGSFATSFENRFFTTELQLCQRYYCELGKASANEWVFVGWIGASGPIGGTLSFPVEMRTYPVLTGMIVGTLVSGNVSAPALGGVGTKSLYIYANGITIGTAYFSSNASSGYLKCNSEL